MILFLKTPKSLVLRYLWVSVLAPSFSENTPAPLKEDITLCYHFRITRKFSKRESTELGIWYRTRCGVHTDGFLSGLPHLWLCRRSSKCSKCLKFSRCSRPSRSARSADSAGSLAACSRDGSRLATGQRTCFHFFMNGFRWSPTITITRRIKNIALGFHTRSQGSPERTFELPKTYLWLF